MAMLHVPFGTVVLDIDPSGDELGVIFCKLLRIVLCKLMLIDYHSGRPGWPASS